MANPRDGFVESIGLPQDALVRLASAFQAWIEPAAEQVRRAVERICSKAPSPKVVEFVTAMRRIEQSPPVLGYEDILISKGHDPLAARLLALNLMRLGRVYQEEKLAGRKLASAVFELAKVGNATPLAISRRAQSILATFDDGMAMPTLRAAWVKAHLPDTELSLRPLIERAVARDADACERMIEVCAALKPHLPDPRGRRPSLASLTHELLLILVERGYTYDPINDNFVDPATRATRLALNDPNFEPRPARRRLRARNVENLAPSCCG